MVLRDPPGVWNSGINLSHRILEWFGLDLKDHLIPAVCHGQGHLALSQVVPNPIQSVSSRDGESTTCQENICLSNASPKYHPTWIMKPLLPNLTSPAP